MALDPGTILSERYTIVRAIKTGGMGSVYEAVDARLANTPCAVKEMLEHMLDGAEADQALRRFSDEMRFLATLSHPHIPRVRDFFTLNRLLYIVMDLIRGDNLDQELVERMALTGGPFPVDLAVDDAIQVLGVLQYLHELRPPVVHRDIKPANLIREHGTGALKLVDFGLVRADTGSARTHTIVGTLSYAALEQLQGHAEPRSDLYGLGATMHHLLTGVAPRPLDIQPLRTAAPAIDERLAAIVDRALATHVEDRFATARDMRVALQAWRDSAGASVSPVPRPAPAREMVPPAAVNADVSPRRMPAWIPASLATAAGVALLAFLGRGSAPPTPAPTPPPPPGPSARASAAPSSTEVAVVALPPPAATRASTPTPSATARQAPAPTPTPAPTSMSAPTPTQRPTPQVTARVTATPRIVNTTAASAAPPVQASAYVPPPPPPAVHGGTVTEVVSAAGQDAHLKLRGIDYRMHLPDGWRFSSGKASGGSAMVVAEDGTGNGIVVIVQLADPMLFPKMQAQLAGKLHDDGWQVTPPHPEGIAWVSPLERTDPQGGQHGQLLTMPQPMPGGPPCLFQVVVQASPHASDPKAALHALDEIVRAGLVHPMQ